MDNYIRKKILLKNNNKTRYFNKKLISCKPYFMRLLKFELDCLVILLQINDKNQNIFDNVVFIMYNFVMVIQSYQTIY